VHRPELLRLGTDTPSQPITYSNAGGSLVRTSSLWIPVDKLTAGLYGSLSERAFRSPDALARWHPDLQEEGATMRITCFEGRGRNTTRVEDFTVQSRFTVGDGGKAPLKDLLQDRWNPGNSQRSSTWTASLFRRLAPLEGFVVNFKAGAKERTARSPSARPRFASSSRTTTRTGSPCSPSPSPRRPRRQATPARWRYDAGDTYIASIGGAADSLFAFEFPCPPGYHPIALYVKGVRFDTDDAKTKNPSRSSTAPPTATPRSPPALA